jgi:hypothetical protein
MNVRLLSVLSLGAALAACAQEPSEDSERHPEGAALIVGSPTALDALPSPVAIHAGAVGLLGADYGNEWTRLNGLGYTPVSLSGATGPDGLVHYSSAFHKDRNITSFSSSRGLTRAEYVAKWDDFNARGFRVLDVAAHTDGSTQRYDGIWVQEQNPKPWASLRDVSIETLTQRLYTDYPATGLRPIRIHGYPSGEGTRFSGAWVQDELGTDFRVILDKSSADYAAEFDIHVAAGYRPIDLSAYPVGGEVHYTGVFVRDPSVTRYASLRNQTLEEFQAKQREYAEANFVLIDAEYYTGSDGTARYAGIWLQRAPRELVSSFDLSSAGTAAWPAAAQTALSKLRTRLASYPVNFGFVVEDLSRGSWLGFRINEPFYMASTSKVLIAGAVLDAVDRGIIGINDSLVYDDADILERADNPTAAVTTTVLESLRWMLIESSTNATDRLVRLVGTDAINGYLESHGIIDVGEVTSICELDRRILSAQNACAATIGCFELERWSRNNEAPTSDAGVACTGLLRDNDDASHEAYYATLANSITPLQYARVWRRLLDAEAISPAMRDELVQIFESTRPGPLTGPFTGFTNLARKGGSKREVQVQVGFGYDVNPAIPGASDDQAQYSFALFGEDYEGTAANDALVDQVNNDLAVDALTVLRELR